MVAADAEGVSPREIADRYNELIREDLRNLGISYDCFTRTTTANHARVTHGHLPHALRPGLPRRAERRSARSPPRRATRSPTATSRAPARSAASRGARRPVRQLREPARPVDLIEPRSIIDGRAAGVPGDDAPLPRPARVRRPAAGVDREEDELAPERPQLLAVARRRPQAAGDDARHRLGHPGPRRRLSRRTTTSGSTSGSTRSSATSRPRSSGRRTRGRSRRLARVVAEPRRSPLLLHGQGQHRLPHGHLAGDAARLRRGRRARRRARAAPASRRRRRERVPDDGGQEVLHEPRRSRSTSATSSSATTPTRSATSSPRRGPRRRTPTSPGPSSSAATTTSCSRTGATSSTGR